MYGSRTDGTSASLGNEDECLLSGVGDGEVFRWNAKQARVLVECNLIGCQMEVMSRSVCNDDQVLMCEFSRGWVHLYYLTCSTTRSERPMLAKALKCSHLDCLNGHVVRRWREGTRQVLLLVV